MGDRILLVEGKDDFHVMMNLFEVRGLPQSFKVKRLANETENAGEGVEALLEAFPAYLLQTDLERLAVVMDADDPGPAARWESIRSRLTAKGYHDVPNDLMPEGMVFDLELPRGAPRSVRFGAWIMPDNRSKGMIESFVARLIRDDDSMLPRVDEFLVSIPEFERRFKPVHRPKARIHTWLAISETPGRPMGQAIKTSKHIALQHPSVQEFLNWIQTALVE